MPTDRSSIVLRASCNWTQEECYFSPAAIVCWWFLLTTGTLRRRKSRYCFTNWGTSSGVFLRTTIPGTAALSETLPKCRGTAKPRLARPHTTVPWAPRPTIPAFKPAAKAVKRATKAQEAAAKETRPRRRFLKWTSAPWRGELQSRMAQPARGLDILVQRTFAGWLGQARPRHCGGRKCRGTDGRATVVGFGPAYFLEANTPPAGCKDKMPLTFRNISVHVAGARSTFDVKNWKGEGGDDYTLSVNAGQVSAAGSSQCLAMLGNQISKPSSGKVNAVEEFWRPLEKARTSESGRYKSARLRDQEKAFCMVRRRGDSWPRADTSSIESMAASRTRSA
jgi:hypothetical protein